MGKTSGIKCPNCGKIVPEDATVQDWCCCEACYKERLKYIQRLFRKEERRIRAELKTKPKNIVIKNGCCEAYSKERLEEIQFAKETVRRVHGYDVDIPLDDPDPWWYVVG